MKIILQSSFSSAGTTVGGVHTVTLWIGKSVDVKSE